MQSIENYVAGLKIPENHKLLAVAALKAAGFTRYDRYRWQEIEDMTAVVVVDCEAELKKIHDLLDLGNIDWTGEQIMKRLNAAGYEVVNVRKPA